MSTIPDGVKMPEDHKTPAQREAEGDTTVTIEHEGHTFTMPADPLDWPVKAMRAFEDGKAFTAIQALIGDRRYVALGMDDWPARKATALFEKFAQAAGLADSGE